MPAPASASTSSSNWEEDSSKFLDQIASLHPEQLTKAVICEICSRTKRRNKDPAFTWKKIKAAVAVVFNDPLNHISENALRTSFFDVYQEKINKGKVGKESDSFKKFLCEVYVLPVPRVTGRVDPRTSTSVRLSSPEQHTTFQQDVDKNIVIENCELQERNADLEGEISKLTKKNDKLGESFTELQEKFKLKERNKKERKRLTQDYSRQKQRAIDWRTKYFEERDENHRNKRLLKKSNESIRNLHSKVMQLRRNMRETRDNVRQVVQYKEVSKDDELLGVISDLERKVKELNKTVHFLEDQLLESEDRVRELLNNEKSTKKDGKSFHADIREASYHLMDLGMAEQNVSEGLRRVYRALTGNELVGPLPSGKSQNRFGNEMKLISRQQVKEALGDQENLTGKFDGSTKGGKHPVEVELATPTHNYLVAVKDQVGGTAKEYHETVKEALQDSNVGIGQISNTMTDRVTTNQCVEKLLAEDKGADLNNFKCGIHPLDTFKKDVDREILKHEKQKNIENSNPTKMFVGSSESHTCTMIRGISKLFYDDRYGTYGSELKQYIADKLSQPEHEITAKKVTYHRYVGNRFHVYFLNAGLVYYYKGCVVGYLKEHHPKASNQFLTMLQQWLESEVLSCYLRVLGLIGKYVTGPWMRFVPSLKCILDLNPHLKEAVTKLEQWIADPTPLLDGVADPVFPTSCLKDPVFKELTKSQGKPLDEECETLLKTLLQIVKDVILRQMSDQLPGGKFWEPSPELYEEALSCSVSNISGERHFGTVDAYMKKAPNASVEKVEARVMFKGNKTGQWLEEKDPQCRKRLIEQASKETGKNLAIEKKRRLERVEKHRELLLARRRQLSEMEEKKRDQVEGLIEDLIEGNGLWSLENIEKETKRFKTKTKKVRMLKAQIHVWNKYLAEKKLKDATVTGKTVEQLIELLKQVQCSVSDGDKQILLGALQNVESLVGKTISQKWMTDGGTEYWDGKIIDIKDSEYEVKFKAETELFYLTRAEVLADMILGDLRIL